jgi:hypothetical protein
MLDPLAFLASYGNQRGWTSTTEPSWASGTSDHFDGEPHTHSSIAAMSSDEAEISRRVWRGQVGVLFPFIEEHRLRLIRDWGTYLSLPIDTTFGPIVDSQDVEIGLLQFLLSREPIAPPAKRFLWHLKEMRHALAHLEAVGGEHLCSADVRNWGS